ncbi:MAG: hypothetical protein AAF517_24180, partial [Planctomycetota bacterium]
FFLALPAALYLGSETASAKGKKVTASKGSKKGKSNKKSGKKGKSTKTTKRKTASIVYMYFGDPKFTTLFQQSVKLSKAMDGYDYTALLYDEKSAIAGIELSKKAIKDANEVHSPTERNFINCIKSLTDKGYMVDIWTFAHGTIGNDGSQFTAKGSSSDDKYITAKELVDGLGPNTNGGKQRSIRMVYTVACYQAAMRSTWTTIGAKVACGARDVNYFPNQFGKFASNWNKGKTFKKSLNEADTAASRTLVHPYILADAKSMKKKGVWDGCKFPKTVLGKDSCAKDYFTSRWVARSDWKSGQSGKEHMIYSSEKLISGDSKVTKSSTPTWN